MDTLEEAKEIMKKIRCGKAYAVYGLELENIAEIRGYNEKGEDIELEKKIHNLTPIIDRKLVLDPEKPIQCPINQSMSKYLEFSLINRRITPYNIDIYEASRIKEILNPLLEKYNWTIDK